MVMEETFIQIHQAILFIKGEPVVFSDLIKIVMSLFIGKYLSCLRKLNHVIAPKEGFEAQL